MKKLLGILVSSSFVLFLYLDSVRADEIAVGKLKCSVGSNNFVLKLPIELGTAFSFWGEKFEFLPVESDYVVHAKMKHKIYEFKVSRDGIWYEKEKRPTWTNQGKMCSVETME